MWFPAISRWLNGSSRNAGRVVSPRLRRSFVPCLEELEDRLVPSSFTVSNFKDSGAGTLRAAIVAANANPGADVINFAKSNGTITLTSGQLSITDSLTINGPGANKLTVSGNNASRVFSVAAGATVSLSGLTVANGAQVTAGAGILNSGTLTLQACTVTGNQNIFDAQGGGGISSSGVLQILDSTISNNGSGNAYGGGIRNTGTATIRNSTIAGNGATIGGGIANFGTMTIQSSTVSGNSANQGAGIYNNISVDLWGVGNLAMQNTILAGNTVRGTSTFSDLDGSLASSGYNLIGSTSGGSGFAATDLLNVDPRLGPLRNNGGPTQTMALLSGSPAINAGDPATTGDYDQRGPGYARVKGGRIDIGAFEA